MAATAKKIKWVDKHIEVEKPKKFKKLTGTRLAAIFGQNRWTTPFNIWCAVTKTYEEPFEDTIYTIAGKTIEPKQAEYMARSYFMDIMSPTDKYGKDYFSKTYGDFFPENKIFGGMWDYLSLDDDGNIEAVLEMKTTKRAEDWAEDIPEYYAVQAALYAYLLGVEDVIMVCSILSPKDYDNPEAFVPSAENTITREFRLHERYPDFEQMIERATVWWNTYVKTGISPDYDENADAGILKALRTHSLAPDTDVSALMMEAEELRSGLETVYAQIADSEKRLKELEGLIREAAVEQLSEDVDTITLTGQKYVWTLKKSVSTKIDKDRLKEDGLLDDYTVQDESYRLTCKGVKQ